MQRTNQWCREGRERVEKDEESLEKEEQVFDTHVHRCSRPLQYRSATLSKPGVDTAERGRADFIVARPLGRAGWGSG